MGIKTNIKISLSLLTLMFAFQNCGNKNNDFSATAADPGLQKSRDAALPLNNVVGEYDVLSLSESVCKGDVCEAIQTVFKSKQTLNLKADGSIAGKAACNNFGGQYKLEIRPNEGTHLLAIKLGASTLMACSLLEEERDLYNALSSAYKIDNTKGDVVNVYSSVVENKQRQTVLLQLKRKKSVVVPVLKRSIVGSYRVVSLSKTVCSSKTNYMTAPCYIQTVAFKSQQSIHFDKQARVSGQAACNRFGGKYSFVFRATEPTDLLSISQLMSTEMACDLLHEEQVLFDNLAKVYKVEISTNQSGAVSLLTSGGSIQLLPLKASH